MRIKVLWIDDEYKKQQSFIGAAEQEGIDIIPFESHEEGIQSLNENLSEYHAVILDAKVKKGKMDTTTGVSGMAASRDRLIEINRDRYIPYFIFTGQPDFMSNQMFIESYGKYYTKAEDNYILLSDIINSVHQKDEYLIQKKYNIIFDICTDKYIGEENKTRIFKLVKYLDENEDYNEDYFNPIRKVLESILFTANRFGILHDKCISNNIVNLTWSCLFLNGSKVELPSGLKIFTVRKFPVIFSNYLNQIKELSNNGSHHENRSIVTDTVAFPINRTV